MSFSAFYGTFLFTRQVSEAEFSTSLLAFIVPVTKPSLWKPHLSTKPLHNSDIHKADNPHFKYCVWAFFCLWHWTLGKCV